MLRHFKIKLEIKIINNNLMFLNIDDNKLLEKNELENLN